MTQPQVWLIRHGETAWSAVRRHTGRTDLPLEPAGEKAAAALAERLKGVAFDRVLASPLQRAWRTAELAGLRPVAEPLAVEWDYGDYEGVTTAEVREQVPGWTVWEGPVPGGEQLADVARRACALVERLRADAPPRTVLVAHGHFLRVLATQWLGLPAVAARHLVLGTATVSVLGWDRDIPALERWNS